MSAHSFTYNMDLGRYFSRRYSEIIACITVHVNEALLENRFNFINAGMQLSYKDVVLKSVSIVDPDSIDKIKAVGCSVEGLEQKVYDMLDHDMDTVIQDVEIALIEKHIQLDA